MDSIMREHAEEHALRQVYPAAKCDEPHHRDQADEAAHRRHHWKERLMCMAFCTALHFILEALSHVWK